MSEKVRLLERKVLVIEQKLDSLSSEFNKAFNYINSDPSGSLNKTRIVMEKILVDIYQREMEVPPKKPMIGEILKDNQFTRKIERRILSRMHAIRDMSNLGTHGEKVHPEDAIDILDNLTEVIKWYFGKYLENPIDFVQEAEPAQDIKPEENREILQDEELRMEVESNAYDQIIESQADLDKNENGESDFKFASPPKTDDLFNPIEELKYEEKIPPVDLNPKKKNVSISKVKTRGKSKSNDTLYYLVIVPVILVIYNNILETIYGYFELYNSFLGLQVVNFIFWAITGFLILWILIMGRATKEKYSPIYSVLVATVLGIFVFFVKTSITSGFNEDFTIATYLSSIFTSVYFYMYRVLDVTFAYFVNQYYFNKRN